jgi:hypothetical protein
MKRDVARIEQDEQLGETALDRTGSGPDLVPRPGSQAKRPISAIRRTRAPSDLRCLADKTSPSRGVSMACSSFRQMDDVLILKKTISDEIQA